MAVIMALLLKCFIVEAYKIPTGSMQPTLIGDEDLDISDRILVDKLSFALRDPKRWEVVVFRFPLDRSKNFVKRIGGIGPEQFRIWRGDLWRRADDSEEWSILRKPSSVLEAVWKRLDRDQPEESSWAVTSGGREWSTQGRSIRAREAGHARFRPDEGAILDRYLDGYPEAIIDLMGGAHRPALNPVGDLRVDGEVRALAGTREITVDLDEGSYRYRFSIPGPAAEPGARPRIRQYRLGRGTNEDLLDVVAENPYRLPADEEVRFGVQNVDDMLALELDGEVVCTVEIASAADQSSGAAIGLVGEGADFEDLMVYRDIYYSGSSMKESEVTIPEGSYYMLGDNTQDSSDSREWSFARYRVRGEEGAEPTILRGSQRRGENPLTLGHGDPDGPFTRLVDEWGEVHWMHGEAERVLPETSPFVPREMILGRALAVFWPLRPRLGLYRLQWVN